MKNKSYLLKYAIDYLSKYNSSKKNLEKILKTRIQRSTNNTDARFKLYSNIEYVFKELEKNNLINDISYTQSKIYSLVSQSKSKIFIQNYLINKGVQKSIIFEELDEFEKKNYGWEKKSAYEFAKKKRLLDSNYKDQKKLGKMARAGFSYELSKEILNIN